MHSKQACSKPGGLAVMRPTSFLLPRMMSAFVEESSSAAAVEAPTLPAAGSLGLSAVGTTNAPRGRLTLQGCSSE